MCCLLVRRCVLFFSSKAAHLSSMLMVRRRKKPPKGFFSADQGERESKMPRRGNLLIRQGAAREPLWASPARRSPSHAPDEDVMRKTSPERSFGDQGD